APWQRVARPSSFRPLKGGEKRQLSQSRNVNRDPQAKNLPWNQGFAVAQLWGFQCLLIGSNDLHATIAVTKSPPTAHRGPLLGRASICPPSPIGSIHAL